MTYVYEEPFSRYDLTKVPTFLPILGLIVLFKMGKRQKERIFGKTLTLSFQLTETKLNVFDKMFTLRPLINIRKECLPLTYG